MQKMDCVSTAAFLDEAQILKTLQHPNIITLLGVCSEREPIYLLLENMCNGRLSLFLREGPGQNLAVTQLIYIGAQVSAPSLSVSESCCCFLVPLVVI